ncbi:MAG: histidine kinase dimerization/phospho-acceptor domain-containing protein, partial [Phycisphaeraceae bacterium JB051]
MIALSAVCLQTFRQLDVTVREKLILQQQLTSLMGEIALTFTQAQTEFKNIQLGNERSPETVIGYLDEIDSYIEQLKQYEDYPQYNIDKEITLFKRETRRFRTALHAYIVAIRDDPSTDYVKESLQQVDRLIEVAVHNAKARHMHLEQMRQSTIGLIVGQIDQSYGFLVVMVILGISLSFGIALWLTGRLRSNVEDILDITKLLGEGNLSCRLYSPHKDSLGQLCDGIDVMAEKLEHAEAKLKQTLEQAREGSRIKSVFLANMSDEFRTPMTAILGFADLVHEEVSEPKSKDKLKVIQRNGRYLLEIINDILDLSKIEANRLTIENLHIDPVGVIDEVVQLHQQRCEEQGLKLRVVHETSMPRTILTDPTRFKQIINNLISNAIKFTEVGSITLKIGMVRMQEQWQMRV